MQFVATYQITGRSFLSLRGEIYFSECITRCQPEIDLGCPTPYTDFGGRLRSLPDGFAEPTIYNQASRREGRWHAAHQDFHFRLLQKWPRMT